MLGNVDRIQAILDLFHDKTFCRLKQSMDENVLTWENFKTLQMPLGYTSEETWTILEAIRHQNAHEFPFKAYFYPSANTGSWLSISGEMAALLNELYARGASHGPEFNPYESAHANVHIPLLATDVSAALERDGIRVDAKTVEAIARGEQPRNVEEQAAANVVGLVRQVRPLAKQQFSTWMARSITAHLEEGCGGLVRTEPRGQAEAIYPKGTKRQYLEDLCTMLENSPHAESICLVDLAMFSMAMFDLDLVDGWSACVELVMRHAFLQRGGLALLRTIPFSRLCLAWERGQLDSRKIALPWDCRNPDCGEGDDNSAFIAQGLRMMLESLHEAERVEARRRRSLERANSHVDADYALNHRQHSLLLELVEQPHEVTIAEHMQKAHIAYATARADLLSLVTLGYLEMGQRGRAQAFCLSEDFKFRLCL